MDKYQRFIVENLINLYLYDELKTNKQKCEIVENNIKLKQLEDITITKYSLTIGFSFDNESYINKMKIEYFENNKWTEAKKSIEEDNWLVIVLDFNDPIEKIRISSVDNLFDPLELKLDYIYANKEEYYARLKAENEEKISRDQMKLNALIKPEHSVGADLVNIYWNKANDDVSLTKINLYMISKTEKRLVGSYKETDSLFKSITGLAYGLYCYQISQFDELGQRIAETEEINFEIEPPDMSIGHLCI